MKEEGNSGIGGAVTTDTSFRAVKDGGLVEKIRAAIEDDRVIRARREEIAGRIMSDCWCAGCPARGGMLEFLNGLADMDGMPVTACIDGKPGHSLVPAGGSISIGDFPPLTVACLREALENMSPVEGFMLDGRQVLPSSVSIGGGKIEFCFDARPTDIIIVTGRAGSGKSSIAGRLASDLGFNLVPVCSTNPDMGDTAETCRRTPTEELAARCGAVYDTFDSSGYRSFVEWEQLRLHSVNVLVLPPSEAVCIHGALMDAGGQENVRLHVLYVSVPMRERLRRMARRNDRAEDVYERLMAEEKPFHFFEKMLKGYGASVIGNGRALEKTMSRVVLALRDRKIEF